jgi:hypothetical protein
MAGGLEVTAAWGASGGVPSSPVPPSPFTTPRQPGHHGLDGTPGFPTGDDFWLASAGGSVNAFGNAPALAGLATPLTSPVVAITSTPDAGGYWLATEAGGVFAFGDARFEGSVGAVKLAEPIVGMASTPDGAGYWLVASDGGIFAFGDAAFHGSTGAIKLNQPIVAMGPTSDAAGYWLLAADGGVFNFGDAGFAGSMGATPTLDRAEKIVSTTDGGGYWIVDQNGTANPFGDAAGAPPTQALLFNPVTPGDKAVLFAFEQLGKPYIWGGNGPVGYDCSGLALASWEHGAGIDFARVSKDQYHTAGPPVALTALQAGDLVFWGDTLTDWATVYHTAMYVGGGQIVESTGDHVQLNDLLQWGPGNVMPNGVRP